MMTVAVEQLNAVQPLFIWVTIFLTEIPKIWIDSTRNWRESGILQLRFDDRITQLFSFHLLRWIIEWLFDMALLL